VGTASMRNRRIGRSAARGKNQQRAVRARDRQRSRHFLKKASIRQKGAATSVTAPPAKRATSWTSSLGVSQQSTASTRGLDRYHPNQSRTNILMILGFIGKHGTTGSITRQVRFLCVSFSLFVFSGNFLWSGNKCRPKLRFSLLERLIVIGRQMYSGKMLRAYCPPFWRG
jgi:hypothetical protein